MVYENKMEIVIDKEKVIREDIYDYDEMIEYLDNLFAEEGCVKISDSMYAGRWEIFGVLTNFLANSGWFPDCVKIWRLYELKNVTDNPSDDDYYVEDFLEEYYKDMRNRKAGADICNKEYI